MITVADTGWVVVAKCGYGISLARLSIGVVTLEDFNVVASANGIIVRPR